MASRTSLNIPDDIKEKLKEIAEKEERTVHWLILKAIKEFVDRYNT